MFQHKQIGDRAITEPVEMPESTKAILDELLAQNRMVLEANCQAMRLISNPVMVVKADKLDES